MSSSSVASLSPDKPEAQAIALVNQKMTRTIVKTKSYKLKTTATQIRLYLIEEMLMHKDHKP